MNEIIIMLGFVQAIFGALIFLRKRPKNLSFTLLALWLVVIALFQGAQLLPFQVVDYFKPGIFPIVFLFGPLLYLYVASLTIENFNVHYKHLLHLIPLLAVSIHRSFAGSISVSTTYDNIQSGHNKIYSILMVVSLFVYWIFSVKLILDHRKNIPYYFSNYTQRNTLTWLIFVVLGFLLLFFTDTVFAFVAQFFGRVSNPVFTISTNFTIFTFIVVFFGINQSVLFKFKADKNAGFKNQADDKYKRSALSETIISDVNKKVSDYLQSKKPYLNPEFSFQMMVDDLGISRQQLSQVINAGQKKNFYKLINEFRVQEVKHLLGSTKYEHLTILGLAFECGFNSKTSFNRIFKEVTGLTPSAYKKSL